MLIAPRRSLLEIFISIGSNFEPLEVLALPWLETVEAKRGDDCLPPLLFLRLREGMVALVELL